MWQRLVLVSSFIAISAQAECPLRDGDLIFIKSQSEQSKLLKLTTGSSWTHVGMSFKHKDGWNVIEAVQPVKWTSLYSFVRRSNQLAFKVKRATFPFDSEVVKKFAQEHLGKNYDLIFAWDQERWYCSELVWKAYRKATGEELGLLEKIGDLQHVDSAQIKKEAQRRFTNYGLPYDHEEWKKESVITPVQMMNATNLETVGGQEKADDFRDCLKQ